MKAKWLLCFLPMILLVAACTKGNDKLSEMYVYIIQNKTDKNVVMQIYKGWNNSYSIGIDSFAEIRDSSLRYESPNGGAIPTRISADSVYVIFDSIRVINYVSEGHYGFSLVNGKNILSDYGYLFEAEYRKDENMRYFYHTFEFTEGDYAAADSL